MSKPETVPGSSKKPPEPWKLALGALSVVILAGVVCCVCLMRSMHRQQRAAVPPAPQPTAQIAAPTEPPGDPVQRSDAVFVLELPEKGDPASDAAPAELPLPPEEPALPAVVDAGASQTGADEAAPENAALYATIWPICDLPIYAGTDRSQIVGTAPACAAFCVAAETDGLFYIRWSGGLGYIEADACLINLPDYLADLCSYDIVNSYAARYRIHGVAIPEVTNTVIPGYEHILQGLEEYLVPLLYPSAKKLGAAAAAAQADGYRLKIYDAYRPGQATRMLYDTTLTCCELPIPAGKLEGAGLEAGPEGLTYGNLMTGAGYNLSSFLARNGSTHNQGIALDLTLQRISDDGELAMQTDIHDLSWYSAVVGNNVNAALLADYMTAAGFAPLLTEWWHFQDNDTRTALGLTAYAWAGVTLEGWHRDAVGWQYKTADGRCLLGEQTLGGTVYLFDAAGHVVGE